MKIIVPILDRRYGCQLQRRRYSFTSLASKIKTIGQKELSRKEREILDSTWPGLYFNRDYVSFYNRINKDEEFNPYYIPDDIYYCFVDAKLNNYRDALALDNKNFYDLLFPDVPQPRTIARKINGVFCDKSYRAISMEDVVKSCIDAKHAILKPAIGTEGGHGIYVYEEGDEDKLHVYLLENKNIIIQEIIKQHPSIAKLHPSSLNTIRILTLVDNSEAKVLSIILRIGINGSKVDNASSGGIFVGVDNNYSLRKVAHDTNGREYIKHPGGVNFEGITIPEIQGCVNFAKFLSIRLMNTSKLVSWDFAVNEDGSPILIEANLAYGELDFHQISNGAIFKDYYNIVMNIMSRKKIKLLNKLFFKYKIPLL